MLHLPQNNYILHLYQAIDTGNKAAALYLINNGVNINFYLNGSTPLHWIIYKNADIDIITLLLDKGANIYATDHHNYTPLRLSIDYYRITAAAVLIQRGALVGENLSILLIKPAIRNNPLLINMLIDYGMQHEPSIHLQCRLRVIYSEGGPKIIDQCIPKVLKKKLSDNANANSTHNQLLTPLHIACEDENRSKLRAFLENRVDHFAVNPGDQIPDVVNKLNTREKIQLLLKNNENIETMSGIGRTPLLEACHHGNDEAVKVLLENHANPHARDWFGRTALHFSCEKKHETTSSIIQLLLEHNVNIEAVNWIGRTPLFVACLNGNDEAVKVLLENHANPNVMDQNGQTALHNIGSWKHETTHEIVQLLLKHNADINAVNQNGWTPLFVACYSGNIAAVKCLLENHANPNVMDRMGETALHLICSRESETTLQMIQLLLKHNADIDAVNQNGWTPLFVACSSGNIAAVKCLLEKHANPNVMDRMGETPLHLICSRESETTLQMIQLLLKHNADIEARKDGGWTPLLQASNFENIVAVKCLLENHANPNVMDRMGETPLHCVCSSESHNFQLIQLLLKHNADINAVNERGETPLFEACFIQNIVAVKCLLENHANPNVTNRNGRTALHCVYSDESSTALQIIQLLLKHNADIDAIDEEGWTPLFKACRFGDIAVVKCLLENHANPNVTDRNGQTALHNICSWKHETTHEIIKLLLKYNADIDAVDEEGWTPLFKAVDFEAADWERGSLFLEASTLGKDEAVKGLLRYGANVNILDKRNRSPLQCAVDKMLSTSPVNSSIYTIIQMLVSQIIKLKTARLNVNACEFITINGVKYSAIDGLKFITLLDDTKDTLEIKCKEETEKMKMESIGIDGMFFYDLLTQHIHVLDILMENEKIQEILKPSIYDEKFPLYIGIIRFRLRDAQIRRLAKNTFQKYLDTNTNTLASLSI